MDNSTNPGSNKPNRTSTVPKNELEMSATLKVAAAKYQVCGIVLPHTSGTQALQLAADYELELQSRNDLGTKRVPISNEFRDLNALIDGNLFYVKGYISEKYGKKKATSYYAQFGIVKVHGNYVLPTDHHNRVESLRLLVEAIHTNGFDGNMHGATFWTDIYQRYKDACAQAVANDGGVSLKVASKNSLKGQVSRLLNCFVKLVYAAYPEQAEAMLRDWGFQREKY